MEFLRSLVSSQPQAGPAKTDTALQDQEPFARASSQHGMNQIKEEEEEDPLAVFRALRCTHDILPQELQDIGAETLEEAIEKSRAKAAADVSANASVTVTVLESRSSLSAPPPSSRISTTTTTSTALPFVPIPLGGPRSAEHIALLYQL